MIWCIYGEIGSGKTMLAVYTALKYIKKGWYVFTNFPMRYAYIISYPSFLKYKFPKNSLVIIDEAHMWFNSRNWQKLTIDALVKFTQSRKFGYDIIYTSQRPESVDVQLRDITTFFCKLENWFFFTLLKYHSKPIFNDTEKRKYDLGIGLFFPKLNKWLYRYYDTYAIVRPDWNFPVMSYLDYFAYYHRYLEKDYTYNFGGELITSLKKPIEVKKELDENYKKYLRMNREQKVYLFARALRYFVKNIAGKFPPSRGEAAGRGRVRVGEGQVSINSAGDIQVINDISSQVNEIYVGGGGCGEHNIDEFSLT